MSRARALGDTSVGGSKPAMAGSMSTQTRGRVPWLVLGAVLGFSSPAHAWIFPEHARITEMAFSYHLSPEVQDALVGAVKDAKEETWSVPLCPRITGQIARMQPSDLERCIPLSLLPALAGDHAINAAKLSDAMVEEPPRDGQVVNPRVWRHPTRKPKKPLAVRVSSAIAEHLADYLNDAPEDVRSLYLEGGPKGSRTGSTDGDDVRRMFMRKLDLLLNVIDDHYTDRAQHSRAHFQDSSVTLEQVLRNGTAGDVDNALAQTVAHHLRSLQLARSAYRQRAQRAHLLAQALLEHAFAIHFLQDAFAAGHIGTSHAVDQRIGRVRRHDYLSRVGLPVTRSAAPSSCHPATDTLAATVDEHCWIAYGDGYLDVPNANRTAEAVARLSTQLALALEPGLAKRLVSACEPDAPDEVDSAEETITSLDPDSAGSVVPRDNRLNGYEVRHEGQYVVHLYPVKLAAPQVLHVEASSDDFDVYLSVRLKQEKWLAPDVSAVNPDGAIDVPIQVAGEYEIRVGSTIPNHYGKYRLGLALSPPGAPSRKTQSCGALMTVAEQLNPRPPFMVSKGELIARDEWTDEDRQAIARALVRGAETALVHLEGQASLPPASADDTATAQLGPLPHELIGYPFSACDPSPRWMRRQHPLCEVPGNAYGFGRVDASLLRPLLIVWPGPTGSIETIEGEDAFGAGFAWQFTYSAGAAVGIHSQVPAALAPVGFAAGVAFRADRLIPGRLNREFFSVNLGITPLALVGLGLDEIDRSESPRYALAGALDIRSPLWTLLGAITTGQPWNLGRLDIGPTGGRLYVSVPARVPDDGMHLIAWDIEVLNFKVWGGTTSRTASLGSGTDTELCLRIGRFRARWFDPGFPAKGDWLPMIAVELRSGYSMFFHQIE